MQMLLRKISLIEVQHGFYATAAHVPGEDNVMADAGSRAWWSDAKAALFTNLSSSWTQIAVPPSSRRISSVWEQLSEQGL